MKHLIGKQLIDLRIGHELEASAIQHQLSQLYWHDLVPAIENIFDQWVPVGEVMEIEQLEIDLGQLHPKALTKEALLPLLQQALQEWFIQHGEKYQYARHVTTAVSLFRKWLFFLEYGFFSWNMNDLPPNWKTRIQQTLEDDKTAIQSFQQLLAKQPGALVRLVRQEKEGFLQNLLSILMGVKVDVIKAKLLTPSSSQSKEVVYFSLFHSWVSSPENKDLDRLLEETENQQNDLIDTITNVSEHLLDTEDIGRNKAKEQGIYIQHAGIVLLHPFLPRFFQNLALVEGANFKDEEAMGKAVHLLHYLTTGERTVKEMETPFLKLLCGLPFNWPITHFFDWLPAELEEADALLQAAIKHWGALGQVSNESLQEGFLQRPGKLTHESAGWKLLVERNSIDVLLNQLPWSISVIKLPWMDEILKIDWN